jgi:hypothetical protein
MKETIVEIYDIYRLRVLSNEAGEFSYDYELVRTTNTLDRAMDFFKNRDEAEHSNFSVTHYLLVNGKESDTIFRVSGDEFYLTHK